MTRRFLHTSEFSNDNVCFHGVSSYGDAPSPLPVSVDCSPGFAACLTGAQFIVKNGKIGDKFSFQIVHPVAGVLNEFITDWYVAGDAQQQSMLDFSCPINLSLGLIIRCVYKSTAEVGIRNILINWHTHEVLA